MKLWHIEGYDCIDDNLNIILNTKNIDIRKIFKIYGILSLMKIVKLWDKD